jgi:hypothetical protein
MLAFFFSRNGHVSVGHTHLALRFCLAVLSRLMILGFILDNGACQGALLTLSSLKGFSFFLQIDFGKKTGKYGREAGQALMKTQKKHKNTTHTRRHAATPKKEGGGRKEGDMSLDLVLWGEKKPI